MRIFTLLERTFMSRTLQCVTWWVGGWVVFVENNMGHVFGRRKTKSIPAAAVNAIYKTRERGLLTRAGAKGRSKATSELSHTPPDIRFKTQRRAFFTRGGETAGVCCQAIIKTKSRPPLGKGSLIKATLCSESGLLFQLLKLMNSLRCLMKPSAANEVEVSTR